MKSNVYRSTLKISEVMDKDTVALIKDQYVNIGEVVVKADELIAIGYGNDNTQQNAQGRIFAALMDAEGNEIEGKLRIMMASSQNIPVGNPPVLLDVDLCTTRQGENDRIGQIPMPCSNQMLSKDKKIQFFVMADKDGQTVSKEKSVLLLDITRTLV